MPARAAVKTAPKARPPIVMPAEAGIHGTGRPSNDNIFGVPAPA